MHPTIILIGPLGAGKTTVGRLLAERLNVPFCSVDAVRASYYARVGYDASLAAEIAASSQGMWQLLRYSKPFEARMVALIVAERRGIIDFGASNSVYEDPALFARVESALAPFPNVILLLPSPDPQESAAILQQRLIHMLTTAGTPYSDELFALNRHFVEHPSNGRLAKRIVYTADRTPAAICADILERLVL